MYLEEQHDDPFANPLIEAIDENDVEKLRGLLQEGKKPDH